MIKVSVITTTARYGGFDVLNDCLSRQTMDKRDFEVIIVDELFEQRRGLHKRFDFNCVHAPPDKKVEYYDNGRAFNQALRLASGELICFFIDYMHVDIDYLERHWEFYSQNPGWTSTGFLDRYGFPILRPDADNGMWSMFATEFDRKYFSENEPVYRERKGGAGIIHPDGRIEMPGEKIYLIPDSVPMEVAKKLNGLDEIYDNGYGANDIDFAVRANLIGHRFMLDPMMIARKLGTPEISKNIPGIKRPKAKTPEDNYKLFQMRMAAIRDGRDGIAVPDGRGAWR
jgi:hypothetical protein